MMQKKIVITGALGHIGSKLIRELPGTFPGAQLVLIDNLITQRYTSLFNLPSGNYSFLEADILTANLEELFAGSDAVIHLAAITNAENSFKKQHEVEEVNYIGTEKVARACLHTKAALIYLSTTSVYGSQSELVDENCSDAELKPQSPYAESKLKGEKLLQQFGQQGLRYVICRFGTVCGVSEGMRFQTAVNKFCWNAAMKQPVQVWSTALHQKRPYLTLSDGVDAIVFILQKNLFDNQLYNVVTDNLTVNDIVNSIREEIPDLKINFVDTAIMNQLSYEVSSEKLGSKGFVKKGNIQKDIKNTIALLRAVHNV